jgi:hypothetical protein
MRRSLSNAGDLATPGRWHPWTSSDATRTRLSLEHSRVMPWTRLSSTVAALNNGQPLTVQSLIPAR